MTWAMSAPRKGTEFPWIAKRAAKFINQLGHNRVTPRCDTAIEALAREVAQARQEGSQTYHGIIGRAVGLVAGQARILKAALEYRIGAESRPKRGYCVGWWNLLHI